MCKVHMITTDNAHFSSGPSSESVFGDALKSQAGIFNGSAFFGNGSSKVSFVAYLLSVIVTGIF